MTPFGMSPEIAEQVKMAQRAQVRLHQAFQLFTLKIAYGAKPREAIEDIDEAMDVWGDYQDAHNIDMPMLPDNVGAIMNKFNEAMDRMGKPGASHSVEDRQCEAGFLSPAQIADAEESAWYCYQTLNAAFEARAESMSPESTAVLEREVEDARNHWRTFGTEQLRQRIQELSTSATRPHCEPGKHMFKLNGGALSVGDCCIACGIQIEQLDAEPVRGKPAS